LDCYPDFTVSLSDPHVLKALTLNIKTSGYKILEGVQPLALIYRIYYKCTRTNMNFQAISRSPRNQTLLIQSTQGNANIRVAHTTKWSDISLPQRWSLTNESFNPINVSHNLDNLDYIKQYLDGIVKIDFGHRSKPNLHIEEIIQTSSSRLTKGKTPTRHSFAGSTTTEGLKRRDLDLEKDLRSLKLKRVQTSSQVSHPCYTAHSQLEEEESQGGNVSPMESDFIVEIVVDPQLCTLRKPFEIDYKRLNEDIESEADLER
jgi:hypothetical protein